MKRLAAAFVVSLAIACASAPVPPPQPSDQLRGLASWYGQEYSGRTTANGEIFDPWQLTAAHRTLPFGTVVDVKSAKTGQTVRVRINDRGPYIHDRMIDLSYAAAAKIGLVEPGTGEVELTVVRVGQGDREPPAPLVVTVPDLKPVAAPPVAPAPTVAEVPVVVAEAKPIQQSTAIETRRQVSADGRRIETVPVVPVAKK
jgi:rare lipoprotein A